MSIQKVIIEANASINGVEVNNGNTGLQIVEIGQGPKGNTGPAGPNSVTSATTSDGTANLEISSLTIRDDSGSVNLFGSNASVNIVGLNGSISIFNEFQGSVVLDTFGNGVFSGAVTASLLSIVPNGSITLASTNSGGFVSLSGEAATGERFIAFPDASGTVALTSQLGITLTGDVTGSGTGSIATTIANGAVTLAKLADIGHEKLIGRHATGAGVPQEVGIDGGLEFNGGNIRRAALTGDVTASAGSNTTTLATVNANVGSFGSATQSVSLTLNAKGLVTAASASTITPAVGSITGLGTGVATALAVNVNATGGVVTVDGTATLTNKTLESATLTGTSMSRIHAMSMSQSPPVALFEDFNGALGAGVYTWTNFGTGSDALGGVGPNVFGVRRMTTGSTSDNQRKTILAIPSGTIFGTEIRAHFAIPDVSTCDVFIGMEQTSGALGRYFLRYAAALNSGRWSLVTGTGAGVFTNFGVNGPSNGNFTSGKRYRTIMRPINATSVYVKIEEADWDGSTWTVMQDGNVTISSYTPSADPMALDIRVNTRTSATRSLEIDYISAENQSITR